MARRPPRPGDLVSVEDVASYHLPGHAACHKGLVRGTELCDCARARFLDANIFRVWPDAHQDALRWGPNPPSASELAEVARRQFDGWLKFQQAVKPDKTDKLIKDIESNS